ncbi:hypothetical protein ACQP2H_31790 (plasmid) [Micromonospora sp. CA-248260]
MTGPELVAHQGRAVPAAIRAQHTLNAEGFAQVTDTNGDER